jgi:rhomboid protease GluP
MAAMLCPSCRKLISQDEPRCPYCGALRPGLWGLGPKIQRLFGPQLQLVPIISMACVVLYVTALVLDIRGAMTPRGGLLGILSPSSRALFLLGMTGGPSLQWGHWWTLLTAIFLHGGLLHIVFNVMWIRQLGSFAEDMLGPARFFVLFMLSGAGGFLLTNLLGSAPSIGASGSIFGLLGAMIAYRRRRGATRDVLTQQFLTWAVVLFAFGLFMPGIDNWAHLGGFATGFLLGQRFDGIREKEEGRNIQLAALALLILTLAGFVLSIVRLLPAFLAA